MPANVRSTFLNRHLLLAYQQCVIDSASCRNHINMGDEGRGKSLVNFRQVACSLGLVVVILYYCLVCYCLPLHLYLLFSLVPSFDSSSARRQEEMLVFNPEQAASCILGAAEMQFSSPESLNAPGFQLCPFVFASA